MLGTAVFYAAVIGAAGFAAFHLQKVVEQMQQASARQEESARQNADMATKLDGVVLQVGKTGEHGTLSTRMFTLFTEEKCRKEKNINNRCLEEGDLCGMCLLIALFELDDNV